MDKRASLVITLVSFGAMLCLYGYILLPGSTFASMDFLNLIYPRAVLVQHAITGGHLPLWNPYEWGGCPLLAAMQGSVLYPPMWLCAVLPQPYGLQVYIFAHLVWAMIGASMLARYLLPCGPLAACFAGLAYAGSGYYLGRIEQANVVAAAAWTPWLIYSAARLLDGTATWRPLLVTFTLAILAAHPQTTFLTVLAAVPLLLVRGRQSATPPRWGRLIAVLVVIAAASTAIAAAQLLPTQELSGLSERVWPYPDPLEPALRWSNLLALFVPRYYNHLAHTASKPLGYGELGLYCGLLTLLLFVSGCLAGVRLRNRTIFAIMLAWLLAMLFALGQHGGISPFLTRTMPLLSHSRGAARMLNSAILYLALVAAGGLHFLISYPAISKSAHLLAGGALLLLLADLCWTHHPEQMAGLVDAEAATAVSAVTRALSQDGASTRIHRFMANDSDFYLDNSRPAVLQRIQRLQPNLTGLEDVRTIDGYEEGLLPTRAWANLLRRYNRNLRSDRVDSQLLAALGVQYMLTDYPIPNYGPDWALVSSFAAGSSRLSLWRNLLDLPPIVPDLETSTGQSISGVLSAALEEPVPGNLAPGFVDRDGYPFAPSSRIATPTALGTLIELTSSSRPVQRSRYPFAGARDIALDEQLSGPLVLIHATYPGWKAKVLRGGAEAPVVLTRNSIYSYRFRSDSPLPRGTVLQLRYHPFSFRLGLFISLSALLVTACAAMWKHGLTRHAYP